MILTVDTKKTRAGGWGDLEMVFASEAASSEARSWIVADIPFSVASSRRSLARLSAPPDWVANKTTMPAGPFGAAEG